MLKEKQGSFKVSTFLWEPAWARSAKKEFVGKFYHRVGKLWWLNKKSKWLKNIFWLILLKRPWRFQMKFANSVESITVAKPGCQNVIQNQFLTIWPVWTGGLLAIFSADPISSVSAIGVSLKLDWAPWYNIIKWTHSWVGWVFPGGYSWKKVGT